MNEFTPSASHIVAPGSVIMSHGEHSESAVQIGALDEHPQHRGNLEVDHEPEDQLA